MTVIEAKEYIHKRIRDEGFVKTGDRLWLTPQGQQAGWTFDMKALFLDKDFLQAMSVVFWSIYDKTKPIQICGLESASIPLITALVMSGECANGLYIRKSKKKKYDLRELEGNLTDAPIVLVDDVVNFGNSVEKQIKVLKKKSRDVHSIFACVHIQEPVYYLYLTEAYGITRNFLFSVRDFGESYEQSFKPQVIFSEKWNIDLGSNHDFNVTHRDQVVVNDTSVLMNADDGYVYSISKYTGDIYWKTQIQKKVPFSLNQPGLCTDKGIVYAPTENGALYQLSLKEGDVLQKLSVIDHIYGEPVLCDEGRAILLRGKDGGKDTMVLVDLKREKVKWRHGATSKITSCFIRSGRFLLLTELSGTVRCFDLNTGSEVWSVFLNDSLNDGVTANPNNTLGYLVTLSGILFILNLKNGAILKSKNISDEPFFFSRPTFNRDKLYITSLHRTVYCVNETSLMVEWEFNTQGRIFGGATIKNNKLFFGNNAGVLYALNARSGALLGTYVLADRVVTQPIHDEDNTIFVPTLGNKVFALSLEELPKLPSSTNPK